MAFHLGKPRMSSLFGKQSQPFGRLSVTKAVALCLATAPLVMLPGMLRRPKEDDVDPARKTGNEVKKSNESPKDTKPPAEGGFGGWNLTSALFSIWYEVTFNTVAPAAMSAFMQNYNHPEKKGKLLSARYAFAAYMLHSPFSWASGRAVDAVLCPEGERPHWMTSRSWTHLGPVVMSGSVGMLNLVASYRASKLLIDYVPGANLVL